MPCKSFGRSLCSHAMRALFLQLLQQISLFLLFCRSALISVLPSGSFDSFLLSRPVQLLNDPLCCRLRRRLHFFARRSFGSSLCARSTSCRLGFRKILGCFGKTLHKSTILVNYSILNELTESFFRCVNIFKLTHE